MVGRNLAFYRSPLCLVLFSSEGQDGLAPRVVDREVGIPLVDDPCTPVDIDMTLSVMRSIKNYSIAFSAVLNSSNIHARG
jgi:hypothetical protein